MKIKWSKTRRLDAVAKVSYYPNGSFKFGVHYVCILTKEPESLRSHGVQVSGHNKAESFKESNNRVLFNIQLVDTRFFSLCPKLTAFFVQCSNRGGIPSNTEVLPLSTCRPLLLRRLPKITLSPLLH
jgi:hypothetical protein